jgi:hypothetical protein
LACQIQLTEKSALKPIRSALKRTQAAPKRTETTDKRTDFGCPAFGWKSRVIISSDCGMRSHDKSQDAEGKGDNAQKAI